MTNENLYIHIPESTRSPVLANQSRIRIQNSILFRQLKYWLFNHRIFSGDSLYLKLISHLYKVKPHFCNRQNLIIMRASIQYPLLRSTELEKNFSTIHWLSNLWTRGTFSAIFSTEIAIHPGTSNFELDYSTMAKSFGWI